MMRRFWVVHQVICHHARLIVLIIVIAHIQPCTSVRCMKLPRWWLCRLGPRCLDECQDLLLCLMAAQVGWVLGALL
jgi:hypothetical protein